MVEMKAKAPVNNLDVANFKEALGGYLLGTRKVTQQEGKNMIIQLTTTLGEFYSQIGPAWRKSSGSKKHMQCDH